MELGVILKAILSLATVVGVLYLTLKIIQKYTSFGYRANNKLMNSDSLKLENIVYIDESTKVVTISAANSRKYILAIGQNNLTVVDKIIAHKELE